MRFSQRIGKSPIKTIFQIESIDEDLKNRLWNVFITSLETIEHSTVLYSSRVSFYKKLWKKFFNLPLNKMPQAKWEEVSDPLCLKFIHTWFYSKPWFEVYDFIEFLINSGDFAFRSNFIEECNEALKIEVSGYRIVDKRIIRITTEEEVQAIENAIEFTDDMRSVNTHLKSSLDFLANRTDPDYRNSIKESISSVEAYCKIIIQDDKITLGKALAIIEKEYGLHGSLKTAFNALYGYTSDAGGIRHAMLEKDCEIDFEDAKFMLVICSAFINYLISKVKMN